MGKPSLAITMDLERGQPHHHHKRRLSLRTRRSLLQLAATTVFLSAVGWFALGGHGYRHDWFRRAETETSLTWDAGHEQLSEAANNQHHDQHLEGTPNAAPPSPPTLGRVTHSSPVPLPTDPLEAWGIETPSASGLTRGLSPWPPPPKPPAVQEAAEDADWAFDYGPSSAESYRADLLEFAVTWPPAIREKIEKGLERYFGSPGAVSSRDALQGGDTGVEPPLGDEGEGGTEWHTKDDPSLGAASFDAHKTIWQTDRDGSAALTAMAASWIEGGAEEGWTEHMLTDAGAEAFIDENLGGEEENVVRYLWMNLPVPVMKADLLRYLLLLLRGGIYTDTDTYMLRHPSWWGGGAKLWRDGEGWLSAEERARLRDGENVYDVLGRPSVVVGVEADVGGREDWHDWYPRPLQLAQWTMASAPYHPIALSAIQRVAHRTARAATWARDRWANLTQPNADGQVELGSELQDVTVLSEPKDGGPLGVVDWTGPGVWTDAVLAYLKQRYRMRWTELRGIKEPLRVGEVVVLPVTGFSPGVQQFGAEEPTHAQAMVQHLFRGSWKESPAEFGDWVPPWQRGW